LYPIDSLFAIPLGLEPLLHRVWRFLEPSTHAVAGHAIFRVALPVVLIALLFQKPRFDSLMRVIALLAITLVAFLAWMTLRHNWDFVDWSFLDEPRYYRPFLPAFLLGWLLAIKPSRRKVTAVLLTIATLYLAQAAARFEWSALRSDDESLSLALQVRAMCREPGRNVIVDVDVSDYITHPQPNVIAREYPTEAIAIGQPATIWLVRRPNEPTAYLLDHDADRRRFEALRTQLGATRVWVSRYGNYEIYRAKCHPSVILSGWRVGAKDLLR
ncbi:MAG TPA: hypothetical protein VMU84_04070, partial [Thermoanaerobaculia bacterium]|nr:hypothetical protein [Thermoanaerobaculia bacterium]